jgi:hypothetical protein
MEYYQHGKLHRDNDKPAIIGINRHISWCRESALNHYRDNPAAMLSTRDQYWYNNGKLHRDDLPAVVCRDGRVFYFVDGFRILKATTRYE